MTDSEAPEISASGLLLRRAQPGDAAIYLEWANDPEVRRRSFDERPVALDEHRDWFARKLASPDTLMLVLEASGNPVGQIRFDITDGVALVGFSLSAAARGKGWGSYLLREGMGALRDCYARALTIRGLVKPDNARSERAFAAAGFECATGVSEAGIPTLVYQFRLKPRDSNNVTE